VVVALLISAAAWIRDLNTGRSREARPPSVAPREEAPSLGAHEVAA
jgi:hypothetical protein